MPAWGGFCRLILIIALLPGAVFSKSYAKDIPKADPRAVQECSARGGGFVKIKDCLPEVHVGLAVIDAFTNAYGSEGDFLKNKCLELNQSRSDAAATCILEAVRDAVKLKSQVSDTSQISDPHFVVIADANKLALLEAAEKQAEEAFPDQGVWGGSVYHPYKE